MRALRDVGPDAFTVVMATGIVGVGARLEGIGPLANVLLALACAAWLLLAVLVQRRFVGSFAPVAATAVIGADLSLAGLNELALALWSLAVALWAVTLAFHRRAAAASLLSIVATESLAVLGGMLARRQDAGLFFVAVAFWVAGLVFYPLVAGLAVRRAVHNRRFDPGLWVVMGALAIATLAGCQVLLAARGLHHGDRELVTDVALATWALASVAIPPLVVVELRVRRWRYELARWSFVFPLGMYGAAGHVLGGADGLPALQSLGTAFFALALAFWTLTAAGLARRAART